MLSIYWINKQRKCQVKFAPFNNENHVHTDLTRRALSQSDKALSTDCSADCLQTAACQPDLPISTRRGGLPYIHTRNRQNFAPLLPQKHLDYLQIRMYICIMLITPRFTSKLILTLKADNWNTYKCRCNLLPPADLLYRQTFSYRYMYKININQHNNHHCGTWSTCDSDKINDKCLLLFLKPQFCVYEWL